MFVRILILLILYICFRVCVCVCVSNRDWIGAGAGKITQLSRAIAAYTEDLILVHHPHSVAHKGLYLHEIQCPLRGFVGIHTHNHTHRCISKIIFKNTSLRKYSIVPGIVAHSFNQEAKASRSLNLWPTQSI